MVNWRRWQCWGRAHEYVFDEVGLDPKAPETSARVLDYFADELDGHRIGFNCCMRCGEVDGTGPRVRTEAGSVRLEDYVENRYRADIERLAGQIEQEHGNLRIDVPSLSSDTLPVRDAMRMATELHIAATKAEHSERVAASGVDMFKCWKCKTPMSLGREGNKSKVRCPACGQRQAAPLP